MAPGKDAGTHPNRKHAKPTTGIDVPALRRVTLLRTRDVAALCAVDPGTVYRWTQRASNPLRPFRAGSRCVRFRLVDLEKFIESGMHG